MEVKKDILIRTYLVFIGLIVLCLFVLGKAIYIQQAEGKYWKAMADTAHIRYEKLDAERGTIFSEEGQVLATSIPEFDIYVDFQADGLIEKNGKLFKENVDSLSIGLAAIFKDKTAQQYRKEMKQGFVQKNRYCLIKRKISFVDYEALKKLPLVRLGKNKSGFLSDVRMKRLNPYRLMANRTIGLARDSNKVGLERRYDSLLSGEAGKRVVRYIAGGTMIPVDGSEVDPKDGCDVVTTLDVTMQDIAQNALMKMMVENEALRGTCIVMETKTGKVKAIANLGRQPDGSYWEDYNYALSATEPGSTFKLVTMISVLEDKLANLETTVDLQGGRWNVGGQTVFDSEPHGMHAATIRKAFEKSSNVGMAKLAYMHYFNNPSKWFAHLHKLRVDTLTGIDVPGEGRPVIHRPGGKLWSNTTLPWMGFGYSLAITPLQTLTLYNAIANNGKMVRPYMVNAVLKDGEIVREYQPHIVDENLCSKATVDMMKICMEGVVDQGTAYALKTPAYRFAGKTGTSLVADKGITYADKMYQSSFCGFFPVEDPQYSIIVVIRNKPHAAKFYGGSVAGPVFREVADRLYAMKVQPQQLLASYTKKDSSFYQYAGLTNEVKNIFKKLNMGFNDSAANRAISMVYSSRNYAPVVKGKPVSNNTIPPLQGLGLKDALALVEEKGMRATVEGRGRVVGQSPAAGMPCKKGENIHIVLN